jgi:hypothetical protein
MDKIRKLLAVLRAAPGALWHWFKSAHLANLMGWATLMWAFFYWNVARDMTAVYVLLTVAGVLLIVLGDIAKGVQRFAVVQDALRARDNLRTAMEDMEKTIVRMALPPRVPLTGDRWLVWSNEHNGWWRPGRAGYTEDMGQAGRFTFTEAQQIITDSARGGVQRNGLLAEYMLPDPVVS